MPLEQKSVSAHKRLVMYFDGTWNKPENNTNVYRLYLMLADRGDDGVPQVPYYNEGVGTHWFDRLSGGAIGWGLSDNMCHGYRWLMEQYDPGDEVFLFGFSRGAFTARSLAGLIARCGLLKPDAAISFKQLFERYQRDRNATPIYELIRERERGVDHKDFEDRVLLDHAWYRRNLIKMVGVWDTVGALGIPADNIPGVSSRTLRFHNTHLSTVVQNSYQALALDEFRMPYWGMLWTNFVPDAKEPAESPTEQSAEQSVEGRPDERMIEQRWFSGAHCDVGGGYRNNLMSQRPLAWLQQKAAGCGLGFRSLIRVDDAEDVAAKPRDSYAEFLGGLWAVLTLGRRYKRWVKSSSVRKTGGWVHTVNERIDRSVFDRCRQQRGYRPLSLAEWAARTGCDLEQVIKAPDPALSEDVSQHGIEPAKR